MTISSDPVLTVRDLRVDFGSEAGVVDAFASLAADAVEAAQQTFDTANLVDEEQGLDLSKLARPTSTWTYMIHDDPRKNDSLSILNLPGVFS